jgi:long-subunit acyl-CoA synthetase (AMP-forming)
MTMLMLSPRKSAGRRIRQKLKNYSINFSNNDDIYKSSVLEHRVISSHGRGLRVLGMEAGKPLCIFADTRAEWLVSAQACFR